MKTLKEWNMDGYKVRKGSKASAFNDDGSALFAKDQVEKRQGFMGSGSCYQGRHFFGGENPDQMDYDLGLCGQD